MTKYIEITPAIRINDYDDRQYTIEILRITAEGKNKGAENWAVVAYCATVKGLITSLQRILVGKAQEVAKLEAEEKFKAAKWAEIFTETLKDKNGDS